MKIWVVFFLLLVFGTSCSKNSQEIPIDPPITVDTSSHIIELGKTSVLRNGSQWNAIFSAYYYTNDKGHFSLITSNTRESGLDHLFSIQKINSREGLQVLKRNIYWNGFPDAYYGVSLDGDQLLNSYMVDTTLANQYVEILHYDSVTQIVEGRFQAFLEGPTTWSFLPDTMKLTEGKFHLKIKE